MDTFDWKLLKTLKETRNITKAAQLLYLSQPTLTKRIQSLEEEFGTELVIRQSRGILFTPKGLFLAEKASQMLNEYEDIKDSLNSFSTSDIKGTLRIGVNAPFARGKLPLIISDFRKLYPNIQFDIYTDYSKRNYIKLCNGELPLGFIRESYSWPHPKLLVSEEKLYLINKEPFQLEQLKNMSEIHSRFSAHHSAQFEYWWSTHFDTPIQSSITVEDSSIAVEFVRQGLGFSLLPGVVLSGRENQFYRLPLQDSLGRYLTRSTWLYYKEKSLQNPVINLFVSFMKNRPQPDCQLPDKSAPEGDMRTAYIG